MWTRIVILSLGCNVALGLRLFKDPSAGPPDDENEIFDLHGESSFSPHGWVRPAHRLPQQKRGQAREYSDAIPIFQMHIPKTGGTALTTSLKDQEEWLPVGTGLYSDEICWHAIKDEMNKMPGKSYMMTSVRHPTMHVYSQYLEECQLVYSQTTPQHGRKSPREQPARCEDIHKFIDYFYQRLDDTTRGNEAFYNAINMQTRSFVCHSGEGQFGNHHIDGPVRLGEAKANLQATDFVFILEHFKESMCVMHARLHDAVPDFCNCENSEEWAKVMPLHSHKLSSPKHSIHDLTQEDLEKVKAITQDDLALYTFAKDRFRKELADVEAKYGKRIMCASK